MEIVQQMLYNFHIKISLCTPGFVCQKHHCLMCKPSADVALFATTSSFHAVFLYLAVSIELSQKGFDFCFYFSFCYSKRNTNFHYDLDVSCHSFVLGICKQLPVLILILKTLKTTDFLPCV